MPDKKKQGKKTPPPATEPAPEVPQPTAEEIEQTQARVAHMFAPHAGDALMRRLEDIAQRLAAEGRIHA